MTTTAETERALVSALGTIRNHWAALITPTTGGGLATKPAPRSLYTRHDHDERDDDLPNLDRRIALRHDVTASLADWGKLIRDARRLTHGLPLRTDTLGLIVFIERHAQWFSGHEAAPDAVDELTTWAGRVRAAATPQRRDWMPLGTCPIEIDSEQGHVACGGQVRAHTDRDPQCHKCGTTAVATWWERVMFPDAETARLVTADEIVTLVHSQFGRVIKPGTVRVWINRGWIESSGVDEKGRKLYDKGAVVYAYAKRSAG